VALGDELPSLLLPLTLIVLAIYLVAIPFYFSARLENRDVLIIYNLMLFAIVGLLTPNRLTVIGWNSINIGILGSLIVTQIRAGREGWVEALQGASGRRMLIWPGACCC